MQYFDQEIFEDREVASLSWTNNTYLAQIKKILENLDDDGEKWSEDDANKVAAYFKHSGFVQESRRYPLSDKTNNYNNRLGALGSEAVFIM